LRIDGPQDGTSSVYGSTPAGRDRSPANAQERLRRAIANPDSRNIGAMLARDRLADCGKASRHVRKVFWAENRPDCLFELL
jgi:hypothetical protein